MTLVETALSIVIMATVITMALGTFGTLVKSRRTTNARALGTALASQLASEIAQNSYADPDGGGTFGPEAGETGQTRAAFDDVDDYHNWTESPPKLKDGTAIATLAGWTRSVTVQYVAADTLADCPADSGLKKIVVTVTDPLGVRTVVTALRSSAGTYDQRPEQTTTAVRWVGVELQVGSDAGTRMVSGSNVLNIVPGTP